MTPQTLLKFLLLSGVVLLVIAIGLRVRLRQPLLVVRQPKLALRAVVAMYGVLPLFVLLVVELLPLRPGVGAALLAHPHSKGHVLFRSRTRSRSSLRACTT